MSLLGYEEDLAGTIFFVAIILHVGRASNIATIEDDHSLEIPAEVTIEMDTSTKNHLKMLQMLSWQY